MANTLTSLAADIYKAADVVSRELVGVIPSVTINGDDSQRVALNDTVRASFTREATAGDVSPSMTIPEGTDQTVDNKTLSITKSRSVQIPYTGEDVRHLNNGIGYETVYGDQLAQAMRTLTNEIETDMSSAIRLAASRAYGTAGTTPFDSDLSDTAQVRKILADNGMPMNDGQASLVIDTTAGAKMRTLTQLTKANEAAGDQMLRQGTLLDVHGFMIKESAQIQSHTAGDAVNIQTDGAHSEGDTVIALADGTTWSGEVKAGDVVAIDGHNYVVVTGSADVTSTSEITIAEPGLVADVATGTAIEVQSDFLANIGFHRTAAELAIRAPAVPQNGDIADDSMIVNDPRSGLTFEVRTYKGYRKAMIEVAAAWGVKAWKPEHIAILFG